VSPFYSVSYMNKLTFCRISPGIFEREKKCKYSTRPLMGSGEAI